MYNLTRKNTLILLQLILLLMPMEGLMATDSTSHKAVLFYPAFCEECSAVIDDFLIPLSVEREKNLELFPIDITEPPGDEIFKKVLERFGTKPDSWNRPALLTGDVLLRGKSEIVDDLPPLLGGEQPAKFTTWPEVPGLQQLIGGEDLGDTPPATSHSNKLASGLAWIVMVSMLISLGYATLRLIKKDADWRKSSPIRSWIQPLLALLGLAIGVYLTTVALTHNEIMCGPIGDCMSVQASPYSKLFGIPISLLGVVFYLGIVLLWMIQRFHIGVWRQPSMLGLLIFSVFGVMFSVYLTSLELFVIHAVCIWCLTSAVLATLIMLTVTAKLTAAG